MSEKASVTLKDIRMKMLIEIKTLLYNLPENNFCYDDKKEINDCRRKNVQVVLDWFGVDKFEDIETDKTASPHPLYEYVKEVLEYKENELQCPIYDENEKFDLHMSQTYEFIRFLNIITIEQDMLCSRKKKDRINVENQINNNLDTLSIPKVLIPEIKCYLLGYHI